LKLFRCFISRVTTALGYRHSPHANVLSVLTASVEDDVAEWWNRSVIKWRL